MPNINAEPQNGKKPNGNGQPVFHVVLVPDSTCDDPQRALTRALKLLERRFGLTCTNTPERLK